MADAYMTEQGCYEGVHKIAGVPQRFISNASVGGRVMCADNKRVRLRGKGAKQQADFDGVSLYPSAMARILGFLRGSPKVWHVGVDLSKVDGYFLKIRVTGVGKKWRFPICRIRTEEGINHWTNDLEGKTLTVDRFTLEDLVKHSHITYEIIQGYYFDEGRNKRVNEVIKHLFNMRKQYQKEGNPLQLIIKLVMNAAYGICGLKPIETDIKYVNEGDDCTDFWQLHCNRIKVATRMNNRQWRFELYKEIDTHFNRQHVACEILSVSKNIMNEVMCLAEDIGAMIQYTDTDSMHIDNDMVTTLDDAFRAKYGRELIGEELGQFHTDFEFKTSYHVVDGKLERVGSSMKPIGEITAVQSIFIGKKTYIDKLQDATGQQCYHIRAKGCPSSCILAKCDSDFGSDPMRLYDAWYEGNGVKIDLTSGGNCCFKSNKNGTMTTQKIIRTFKFPLEA